MMIPYMIPHVYFATDLIHEETDLDLRTELAQVAVSEIMQIIRDDDERIKQNRWIRGCKGYVRCILLIDWFYRLLIALLISLITCIPLLNIYLVNNTPVKITNLIKDDVINMPILIEN